MENLKYIPYFIIGTMMVLSSCNKEYIYRIGEEDVYEPTDTIVYIEYYAELAEGRVITQSSLPDISSAFDPLGICVSGDSLYVANWPARTIELFDIRSLEHLATLVDKSNSTPLNSRDVCVSDSLLLVPGINPSQVSVYNRFTGTYLCRLGNGSWAGALTHANSIAADRHFVYVRDQSENIKVFRISDIHTASNNQANLDAAYRLPVPGAVWNSDDYDMLALDNKLYAVNNQDKTLYVYVYDPFNDDFISYTYSYENGATPYGITASSEYVFVSTQGNVSAIYGYILNSFVDTPQLDEPLFAIPYKNKTYNGQPLENIHFMAAKGDSLFIRQNNRILQMNIKERHFDLISPEV